MTFSPCYREYNQELISSMDENIGSHLQAITKILGFKRILFCFNWDSVKSIFIKFFLAIYINEKQH